MIEQRKSVRRKTYYGAQISIDAFPGWSVDGTVKNLGPGGARIALPPRTTLPDRFTLDIFSKAADAARLVWHRDGLIGVAFDARAPELGAIASEPSVVKSTPLERRIAAIVGRAPATTIPFERRSRRDLAPLR